jgi:hypothetical protein
VAVGDLWADPSSCLRWTLLPLIALLCISCSPREEKADVDDSPPHIGAVQPDPAADALVGQILVERYDFNAQLPVSEKNLWRIIYERDRNKEQLQHLSVKYSEYHWVLFKAAMLRKAAEVGLPAESLERCLNTLEPISDWSIGLLPIAALYTQIGREDAWIVIMLWESRCPVGNADAETYLAYGHIRAYAWRARNARTLQFVTCG